MNAHAGKEFLLPNKGTIADFHVYALEWDPDEIRWYVDGHAYATQSFWWSSSRTEGAKGARPRNEADLNPWPAPFDQPFYLVMNVAVGGRFPGNPDRTTAFPVEMVVDYVRVYELVGGYGKLRSAARANCPLRNRSPRPRPNRASGVLAAIEPLNAVR
jgi:beta-glucanase (GH16 family)